jgi:hypothetical protein
MTACTKANILLPAVPPRQPQFQVPYIYMQTGLELLRLIKLTSADVSPSKILATK